MDNAGYNAENCKDDVYPEVLTEAYLEKCRHGGNMIAHTIFKNSMKILL